MDNKVSKILIPLMIVISVTIGFTIAYFSDVERSENNVFSAGTLDLNLQKPGGGEANALWQAENWLPGDEVEGEIEMKNDGSIPIESLIMEVEIE